MGIALVCMMLADLCVWVICLVEILAGNGSANAFGATYLQIFVVDTIFLFALIWAWFAYQQRLKKDEAFLAKHGKHRKVAGDGRLGGEKYASRKRD